jgi:hypothetical protein
MKKKNKKATKADAIDWFLSKTKVNEKTGCLLWTGPIGKNPAPRAKIGEWYRQRYNFVSNQASRAAFALFRSREFDPDLLVLHKRECPSKTSYKCVNPEHLYQGTSRDNGRDAFEFGNAEKGEDHWHNVLTKQQVIQIRKLWNAGAGGPITIARMMGWKVPHYRSPKYGSIQSLIRSALQNWKHIKYPITRSARKYVRRR